MKKFAFAAALALAGCVQVDVTAFHGRSTQHQDIARVTSSEQSAPITADVPISLVPK